MYFLAGFVFCSRHLKDDSNVKIPLNGDLTMHRRGCAVQATFVILKKQHTQPAGPQRAGYSLSQIQKHFVNKGGVGGHQTIKNPLNCHSAPPKCQQCVGPANAGKGMPATCETASCPGRHLKAGDGACLSGCSTGIVLSWNITLKWRRGT